MRLAQFIFRAHLKPLCISLAEDARRDLCFTSRNGHFHPAVNYHFHPCLRGGALIESSLAHVAESGERFLYFTGERAPIRYVEVVRAESKWSNNRRRFSPTISVINPRMGEHRGVLAFCTSTGGHDVRAFHSEGAFREGEITFALECVGIIALLLLWLHWRFFQ